MGVTMVDELSAITASQRAALEAELFEWREVAADELRTPGLLKLYIAGLHVAHDEACKRLSDALEAATYASDLFVNGNEELGILKLDEVVRILGE